MELRTGWRSPRPIQARPRATTTSGQELMATSAAKPAAVVAYPPTARLRRQAMRSLYQPLQSRTAAEEPSATPSTTPTASTGAPSPAVRKSGSTARMDS